MKLRTKIWLIVAACLILVGAILFGGALSAMNWDFTKLSTDKLETNRYELTEDFQNITLTTVTADVTFLPATDGKTTIICTEWENQKHSVTVEDGMLTIKMVDTRPWYHYIFNLHFGSPKLTVYLPNGEYGDLTVKATTGDIEIKNLIVDAINLHLTTGDAKLTDLSCTRLSLDATTGDAALKNVITTGSLKLKATTGDVKFDGCDAADIFIKLTTGDVTGNLLTGKIFTVKTTTGDIDVPPSSGTGKCQITATTGDVRLTIK